MDMVGAILVGIEAFRRFKGTKLVLGQTYGTFLNPPTETEEFKSWSKRNLIIAWSGLGLLFLGFGLQIVANWVH